MTLGDPASCRAALSCHRTSAPTRAPGDAAAGAATGQVRLGLAQPVGPPGQHAGAEGRVQLVPGEGGQSTSRSRTLTGWCRASWAASSTIRAPSRVERGGQFRTGHSSPVTLEAPVTQTRAGHAARGRLGPLQGLDGLRGRARGVEVGHVGVPPGQQRGVVLGLEDEDPAVRGRRGGEQVRGSRWWTG